MWESLADREHQRLTAYLKFKGSEKRMVYTVTYVTLHFRYIYKVGRWVTYVATRVLLVCE
ncbi:hypothetical protein Hanom_Chr07g00607311 [Helianthus anomalus]